MSNPVNEMSFTEKQNEFNAIVKRIEDNATPIEQLAEDATRAKALNESMQVTLKGIQAKIIDIFEDE